MSAVYLLSALPFFAGGAAITIAISRLSANINAVYAADLLGAGAGCLLLMPALNILGAPGAIVAAAVDGIPCADCCSRVPECRSVGSSGTGVFAVILLGAARAGEFDVSTTKGHENHAVLFSKWNSFSRIGVYDQPYGAWSLSDRYTGPLPETRLMDIDSAAGDADPASSAATSKDGLVPAIRADGARLPAVRREPGTAEPRRLSPRWSSAPAAGAICCRRWSSAPRAWTASRSTRSSSTT